MYCWGESWERAKVHAECYDYLFGAIIKLKMMNLEVTLNFIIQLILNKIPRTVGPSVINRAWILNEENSDLVIDKK